VKQAAASKIVVPIVRPSLAYAAMIFRLRGPDDKRPHPVLGDRQVRRAMAMAIDRPTLVRNILDTLGAPGIGPIVRALRVAGTEDKQLPHNVEAAKALLDSAGWRLPPGESVRQRAGKRLEFHLLVNATNATQSNAAAIVQDQLKKVGVQVHVDAIEHNLVVKQFMAKKFDAVMLGFQADASPSGIRQNWTTEAAHSDGGFNRSGYESPAFDATVDSAASSFDPATSAELYKRAVAILLADVPAIWVYEARGTGAVHRRVRTAPMRADYWWAHLDEWSIDPAKMIARDSIGLRAPTP
jgi:ABC-type transport system substrate-binding protein